MGEAAEAILEGEDCQECGEYIGGGDGYPRTCSACQSKYKPNYANFFPIKSGQNIDALRDFLKCRTYNVIDEAADKNGKPLFRILHDTDPENDYKLPDRVATVVCINIKLLDSLKRTINSLKKG